MLKQRPWRSARTWLFMGAALLAMGLAAAPAAAQEPELVSGEVPQEGFALMRVEQTASPQQVRTVLQERGCALVSMAITVQGRFVTYVPGAPAFVNASFPATMAATTAFVVRCEPAQSGDQFGLEAVDQMDREGYGVIRDVRVASHEGFDRFVLEFGDEVSGGISTADGVPGYSVQYIAQGSATQCGSGFDVELEGQATLQVNFPQAYIYNPETGESTVEPLEITTDYAVVQEVEEICGFEGHSTWVIGLTEQRPFRITELQDPIRLVIDIATP